MKIFAPNLRYLKWVGYITCHNCLGSLMHLECVELFLQCKDLFFNSEDKILLRKSIKPREITIVHVH